jgi:hypothetical protein
VRRTGFCGIERRHAYQQDRAGARQADKIDMRAGDLGPAPDADE